MFQVVTLCAMLWSLPQIWPYYKAYIFPYWSSVLLPMVQITLMSSVYTTIIMSWERYVRICMVSKVETICFPSGVLAYQCTEVRFASLLSGGFITAIVVNPPERKLAKRTSVHCMFHSYTGEVCVKILLQKVL